MRFALPVIRLSNAVARYALLTFAAVSFVAAAPLVRHGVLYAQETGIAVGTAAPAALMETLDGKPIDLKSFIGTQPVVLEFWATWCPVCKELEPRMVAAAKKYGTQAKFVTVAVSVNQTPDRVKAWQKIHQLPMDILYDRKGNGSDAYDVPATSYVVVVNKAGKVVYTGVGGTQDLDAAIKKAM